MLNVRRPEPVGEERGRQRHDERDQRDGLRGLHAPHLSRARRTSSWSPSSAVAGLVEREDELEQVALRWARVVAGPGRDPHQAQRLGAGRADVRHDVAVDRQLRAPTCSQKRMRRARCAASSSSICGSAGSSTSSTIGRGPSRGGELLAKPPSTSAWPRPPPRRSLRDGEVLDEQVPDGVQPAEEGEPGRAPVLERDERDLVTAAAASCSSENGTRCRTGNASS